MVNAIFAPDFGINKGAADIFVYNFWVYDNNMQKLVPARKTVRRMYL